MEEMVKSRPDLEEGAYLGPRFCQSSSKPLIERRILVKYLDLRVYVDLTWINNLSH